MTIFKTCQIVLKVTTDFKKFIVNNKEFDAVAQSLQKAQKKRYIALSVFVFSLR